MIAKVKYNDFTGSAAADIVDNIAPHYQDKLQNIGRFFKLNSERFKVVGISITGTTALFISLICIDKEKSTDNKEHIVEMSCGPDFSSEILNSIFKRLKIVLFDNNESNYQFVERDEMLELSDFITQN